VDTAPKGDLPEGFYDTHIAWFCHPCIVKKLLEVR